MGNNLLFKIGVPLVLATTLAGCASTPRNIPIAKPEIILHDPYAVLEKYGTPNNEGVTVLTESNVFRYGLDRAEKEGLKGIKKINRAAEIAEDFDRKYCH